MSKKLQEENAKLKKQLKEKDDLLAQGKKIVEDLRAEVAELKNQDTPDVSNPVALGELQVEILDEAKKITKNEVSSCYELVQKTRELIKLESVKA